MPERDFQVSATYLLLLHTTYSNILIIANSEKIRSMTSSRHISVFRPKMLEIVVMTKRSTTKPMPPPEKSPTG